MILRPHWKSLVWLLSPFLACDPITVTRNRRRGNFFWLIWPRRSQHADVPRVGEVERNLPDSDWANLVDSEPRISVVTGSLYPTTQADDWSVASDQTVPTVPIVGTWSLSRVMCPIPRRKVYVWRGVHATLGNTEHSLLPINWDISLALLPTIPQVAALRWSRVCVNTDLWTNFMFRCKLSPPLPICTYFALSSLQLDHEKYKNSK